MAGVCAPQQYACMADGCTHIFGTWGDARLHMTNVCKQTRKLHGKPTIKDSGAKARTLLQSDASLMATVPHSAHAVTEDELVALIAPYYARGDLTPVHKRTQLLTDVIRPRYGQMPFGNFGHGSLEAFLERHGFEGAGHMGALAGSGRLCRARKTDGAALAAKKAAAPVPATPKFPPQRFDANAASFTPGAPMGGQQQYQGGPMGGQQPPPVSGFARAGLNSAGNSLPLPRLPTQL